MVTLTRNESASLTPESGYWVLWKVTSDAQPLAHCVKELLLIKIIAVV